MSRARNLKPGFFSNEDLAECSPWARLCFAGLWTLADREGRLEDRPKRIKGELFRFDSVEVEPLLRELERYHFILRYDVEGEKFIQVVAFKKHQTPHYSEKKSVIKPPPLQENATNIDEADSKKAPGVGPPSRGARNPLNPESRILTPDSPNPEKAAQVVVAGADAPPAQRATRLPQGWQLPKDWGEWAISEYPLWTPEKVRIEGAKFADHWHAKAGKDAAKLDWLATWRSWCRSDIAHRDDAKRSTAGRSDYEPEWRRQQRERNEEALGPFAVRKRGAATVIDIGEGGQGDGATKLLG